MTARITKTDLGAAVATLTVLLFFSSTALADDATLTAPDFIAELATTVRAIGGLSTLAKVAAVITLIVSSLKVTILRDYVWAKLGAAQVLVAPALGLAAGLLGLATGGAPLTLSLVAAYATAGGGAVLLHELLDAAKSLPGVGARYVSVIAFVEKLVGPAEKS